MKKPELRPYQAGAIDLVYEGLANNRLRQLLLMVRIAVLLCLKEPLIITAQFSWVWFRV